MAKKYYRVPAHFRVINGEQVWVIAHIRKNPKYKETKMQDNAKGDCQEEQTEGKGRIGEGEIKMLKDGKDVEMRPAKKEFRPTTVSVVIREADNHYLATFDHGSSKRIFHNIQELLMAIEVQVKRLGGTLGGG